MGLTYFQETGVLCPCVRFWREYVAKRRPGVRSYTANVFQQLMNPEYNDWDIKPTRINKSRNALSFHVYANSLKYQSLMV